MRGRQFDEEERQFLQEHIPGRSYREVAEMLNAWNAVDNYEHGGPVTEEQVRGFAGRYGIRNGRNTRFKKGQVSHNKGKHCRYSPASEFKKGHMPHNHKPVGSISVRDGYTWIKVAEPKKWKMLHVVMWEQAHGPVPKGCVVIFGDGNRQNITIENLLLVTRGELAVLNKFKLIGKSVELTETGVLVADLLMKMRARKQGNKKGGKHEALR